MKTQPHTNPLIRSILALALSVAAWSPVGVRSAEPAEGKMMMPGKMMERCQEMIEQKQKTAADIKTQDNQLAGQLTKMNRAPEGKKLDLLAALVTTMVEQQTAMNARKAKMEEEMMKHMTKHMQMGMESMSQCPMMKGMDDKPSGAHKEHHESQK